MQDLTPREPGNRHRKDVVEAAIRYIGRSCWRTAKAADPAEAQRSLDLWCLEVADRRRRGPLTVGQKEAAEPLQPLPATPYPAELRAERLVSASALVAFEGNRYSIPPALAGQTATVRLRVGEPILEGEGGRQFQGNDPTSAHMRDQQWHTSPVLLPFGGQYPLARPRRLADVSRPWIQVADSSNRVTNPETAARLPACAPEPHSKPTATAAEVRAITVSDSTREADVHSPSLPPNGA